MKNLRPDFERELSYMHPAFSAKLLPFYDAMLGLKLEVRLTSGLRSLLEQKKLFEAGRSEPGGIKTHNLLSMHNYGLAADFCFRGKDPYPSNEDLWKIFRQEAEKQGLSWGGMWKTLVDKPHLECSFGIPRASLDMTFHKEGLRGVWELVDKRLGVPRGTKWLYRVKLSEDRLKS